MRNSKLLFVSACAFAFLTCDFARAQHAPAIGYIFPPGGQAGKTVDVVLGGYDWTPDMQVFVHDPRIKLDITGNPGPVIVPEPPYWFGKKARRGPFPLPRETKARLTIPADVEPGVVKWQAANANGATASGRFVVSDTPEITEVDGRQNSQRLDSLPVTVSGQIKHIEEVDRYAISVPKSGLVTCELCARKIGSILNAAIEVHDENGNPVADAADTAGVDCALTFRADANKNYTISVYDVDFRGNRSFVYRLAVTQGPRVVATIPSVGRRGETRSVEFVGYGIASGEAKLESVTQEIQFPTDESIQTFPYQLKTSHGTSSTFKLHLSNLTESIETADANKTPLTLPVAVTGVLEERFGEDRFLLSAKKGDSFSLELVAAEIGSALDVSLAVYDATGNELARNDDVVGSTDAALLFKAPADGEYSIGVTDVSGNSGNRAAVYRLVVKNSEPGFTFTTPEFLNATIGGKAKIVLKAVRIGGFQDAVTLSLVGLPEGVTVPADLTLPAKRPSANIELTVSETAAATAALARIIGEAKVGEKTVRQSSDPILIATTIKPPFIVDAEGKDDVTKWPRGTTFPAPVLIERDEGFDADIVLEMASKQGRHRQGINGPELTVKPGIGRILYPVFLPEWLETTRTSRMIVNGVAQVADPKGNVRYSVSRQKTRMGFLPTGALMKIAADLDEFEIAPGQTISVPLDVSVSKELTDQVHLELVKNELFTAKPLTLAATQRRAEFSIQSKSDMPIGDEHRLTIRATVMQNGQLPVVSETSVLVQMVSGAE